MPSGAIAAERGVTRAQVALAWLQQAGRHRAARWGQHELPIDDAVNSLDIELTSEELATLERPYTPRCDWQGISDEAELQRIRDQIPGYANA
jgi:aryl-alcohol dehydrogenase-like predicted oxidoreductase